MTNIMCGLTFSKKSKTICRIWTFRSLILGCMECDASLIVCWVRQLQENNSPTLSFKELPLFIISVLELSLPSWFSSSYFRLLMYREEATSNSECEVWWVAFEADLPEPRFGNGTLRLQRPFGQVHPRRNSARENPTQIQIWEIPFISPFTKMWFLRIPTVHKFWDKVGKKMGSSQETSDWRPFYRLVTKHKIYSFLY